MPSGEAWEPLSDAIVKADDSIIGDRIVGGFFLVEIIAGFSLVITFTEPGGFRTFCFVCVSLGAVLLSYLLLKIVKRNRRKRRHAIELDYIASQQVEKQRQLAEAKANGKFDRWNQE